VEKKIIEAVNKKEPGAEKEENDEANDVYFDRAGRLIIEKDKASIGMLQRAFKIGFNRAARIMDQLCDAGVVGEEEGTKASPHFDDDGGVSDRILTYIRPDHGGMYENL
jgi:S-DNA-T family DNA segregation ATPase FtsK/SpoIIIE